MSEPVITRCLQLPLDRIQPSRLNPRSARTEAGIVELAQSIRRYGLLQPIVVRPAAADRWQIVAGHRRFEAARRAGLDPISAFPLPGTSDRLALELMLAENVQRENLDPIDEATVYQRLKDECQLTQEQLAARVGKSQPYISAMLGLLLLPVDVQHLIRRGEITASHGKRLVAFAEQPEEVRRLAKRAVGQSVADWSREVASAKGKPLKPTLRATLERFVALLEGREEPLGPEEWTPLLADAQAALGRGEAK
jgi:ParB family chromosome partitioning protein